LPLFGRKFMRILFVGLVLTFLSGCVTTSAPELALIDNRQVEVSASVTPGLVDGELTITFDNTVVIKQRSQVFGGSSQSFTGSYKGHKVTARATLIRNMFSSYTQIDVFYKGRLIETLVI
jgi:predicted oxidoreductase